MSNRNMKQRKVVQLAKLALVTVLAAVGSVMTTPASSGSALADTADGSNVARYSTVVLYDGKNFEGSAIIMSGTPATFQQIPSFFNNRASSYSVTEGQVVLHTGPNGAFCQRPQEYCQNFHATGRGNLPDRMNNEVSSVSYR